MKRFFSMMLIAILTVTTIFQAIPPVVADAAEDKVFADGEYNLPFVVWQADKDETSVADGYLDKPAKLIVKDGEYTVEATLKNDSWWQYFKVDSKGDENFSDVTEISKDEAKDESVVQFSVRDLDAILDAKIHVIVSFINYDNHYDIRFKFDTTTIPLAPEPEPAQPEAINIAEGDYTIQFEALHAAEDKASGMARYMNNPAKVSVKNGKTYLTVTINDHKTVTGFQVEANGSLIEPIEQNVNEEANTRDVVYELNELFSIVNARVQYTVGNHNGNQPLRLAFNEGSIVKQVVEQPEEEEPEEEQPGQEAEAIEIAEGDYTIQFEALHANEDKASGMARYLNNKAKVSVKDGKTYLTLTITDHNTVTGFQVENNGELIQPAAERVDEGENTREVDYEINSLYSIMNAQVQYEAPYQGGIHYGDQSLRLAFNEESLEAVVIEEEDPKEEPKEEEQKVDPYNLENGEYTIEYKVLKNMTDETSVMNDYVVSPGNLKVKDGKMHLAITLKNSAWITDFKVDHNGTLVDPTVLSSDNDTDTRVVEFEVTDLFEKLDAWVKVDIAALNYHHEYDVQFLFDTDSIKRLADGEKHPKEGKVDPIATPKETEKNKDDEDDDGLGFNRNDDQSNDKNKNGVKNAGKNPQTSDTTKIALFLLLLVGSSIPLVMKLRKKLATN